MVMYGKWTDWNLAERGSFCGHMIVMYGILCVYVCWRHMNMYMHMLCVVLCVCERDREKEIHHVCVCVYVCVRAYYTYVLWEVRWFG